MLGGEVCERRGAWHDFGVSTPPTESRRVPEFPWNWRRVVIGSVVVILLLWAIPTVIEWLTSGDGLPELDLAAVSYPYLILAGFVTFDAVIPILPSESLLNAASTLASQGEALELGWIILAGAIGAVVGDSLLYWIARTMGERLVGGALEKAQENPKVRTATEVLGETAPLIIVAGRFVPGVRFFVNATMGLSRYPYPQFLGWSALGGIIWSGSTCVFSFWVGTKLGDWLLLSMIISATMTGAILALLYMPLKRRWEENTAGEIADEDV